MVSIRFRRRKLIVDGVDYTSPTIRVRYGIRKKARQQVVCDHDWRYDEAESRGPWTGYMERCSRCGLLQQVPQ